MKNIVILGAGGFIGSSLVRRFIREDVHIWALDKYFKDGAIPDSNRITRIINNSDGSELKHLFKNVECDLFYNFAWQGVNGSDRGKYDLQINNILLTIRYAELAKTLGCKKYLCAGTIAERAIDSLHLLKTTSDGIMYSAAKKCSHIVLETYCKNIGLNFVWMQFSNIYGPRNRTGNLISYTIDQLRKGKIASFGPAQQPYDFLYVDDLIEAVYRIGMLQTENNFYYIGSNQPRILKDYLKIVGEFCGKPSLIHIGERADDRIEYSYDMMDSTNTIKAIGNYVSDTFENHIRYTIDNY